MYALIMQQIIRRRRFIFRGLRIFYEALPRIHEYLTRQQKVC